MESNLTFAARPHLRHGSDEYPTFEYTVHGDLSIMLRKCVSHAILGEAKLTADEMTALRDWLSAMIGDKDKAAVV